MKNQIEKLSKHYNRKISSLPQWVQFELEDKLRIEQLSIERYQNQEQLLKACEDLVSALEPFKNQNCIPFSGFPEHALKAGKIAISRLKGGI